MKRTPSRGGFTLLEVVVAMAILASVLMAIFDLNAGAVRMHVYAKRVTVASLLARSKMTDIENMIYEDGPSPDDEEEEGDFSEEGWESFKWRARILAPRTQNLTPEQLMTAMFNIPLGDGSDGGGLADLFKGMGGDASSGPTPAMPTGADGAGGILGMLGPMAGMAQGQFQQVADRISQGVREVHLTVSWKDGDIVESIDLVTHIVAFGPGADRNGAVVGGQSEASNPANAGSGAWVDSRTGQPANCVQVGGQMVNPANRNRPCVQAPAGTRAPNGVTPPGGTGPGSIFNRNQGNLFKPGGLMNRLGGRGR